MWDYNESTFFYKLFDWTVTKLIIYMNLPESFLSAIFFVFLFVQYCVCIDPLEPRFMEKSSGFFSPFKPWS